MSIGTFSAQDYQYPLDMIPSASFAYSIRQLSKSFSSSIMTIRRTSDGTSTNLSFDSNGKISNSSPVSAGGTLGTWMSGTNVFISSWTDQSSHGNTITQATTTAQPQLASAGALLTPGPAFTLTQGEIFITALTQGSLTPPFTTFHVGQYTSTTAANYTICDSWVSPRYTVRFAGASGTPPWAGELGTIMTTNALSVNTLYLLSGYNDSTSASIYVNGVANNTLSGTNTLGFTGIVLGRVAGGNGGMIGNITEVIVYNSDLTTSQFQAMNSNINNFYGI